MKRLSLLVTALLLSLLGLLGMERAYEYWCAERIYPGVRVWNVPVGGMRPQEAAHLLEERLGNLEQATLTLHGPERSWGAPARSLGVRLVAQATAEAAFRVGRGPTEGWLDHLDLLLSGRNLSPILSFDEAAARLYLEALAGQINQPPTDASLIIEGSVPVATAARSGRQLDVETSLVALQAALSSQGAADLVVREIPAQVRDAETARAQAQALLAEPFTLVLPNPREGDPGPWTLAPEQLAAMLTTAVSGDQVQVILDPPRLQAYLETLTATLTIPPVDARFHFDDLSGQLVPIAPSADGRALDVAASAQSIQAAVAHGQHVAPLILQTVPPRYPDTATAEALGIRERVVTADSYFIGSPSGRDHNIRLAASKFDGLIIAPGETFSFNTILGEISAEAGYDEAYVTAGEQLAVEIGGGVCQVSTTAFRAALWGGYPIVERWYHYQRVGYYELRGYGPGFDATVYAPLLDFRFTNDRAAPLLIETEIQEADHRLIFRFYSADDGRRVEIAGPQVSDETQPAGPIYTLDETLEPGTVTEWQTAQNGLTARVERWVYRSDGTLLYHNVFISRYAPRRAAYRYGPGYQPPSAPSPLP